MSIVAIQYDFADYLTAIDRALDRRLRAAAGLDRSDDPATASEPDRLAVGRSSFRWRATSTAHRSTWATSSRNGQADFDRGLAELPAGVFGWFSKQGWVDSAWEQVDFCLEYPKPDFSLDLRPPYNGALSRRARVDVERRHRPADPAGDGRAGKDELDEQRLPDDQGRDARHPADERMLDCDSAKLPRKPGAPRRTSLCNSEPC